MSLAAHGVVAGYRRRPPVLTDVSISVPAGTIVGLSGPSGTGKTTLARVLALLDAPRAGSVSVDDQVATGTRFAVQRELRGSVAMLFQSPRASTDPRLSLRSIIAQPAEVARRPVDVEGVAARVGLTPDLLTRRPYQVSDGQLQRACLARALAQGPRYLICDEATAMLDAATTATLVRLVEAEAAAQDVGVLLISHDEELLAACCSQVSALADLRREPAGH
ncbi:ATP-binding cassette domain-containing protein [Oerskovia sp. Sa1BUA8]|uniref:ATP-binding cassette domain-containing protein n=1 Tax=Oerskovia douganii TaxID=2762210 RepID=A0A9D5Z0J6_9CELL|nr:ATP-binding cassette domain-containing protein [Oerskovia douganii]MBE7702067.1 ATP-binding cassette domain-containing protein [Oerskovia douganii]